MNRDFVSMGAWLGFLTVALGAFSAHALKDRLSAPEMDIWRTAVQYQGLHALALIAVGLITAHADTKVVRAAGWLFLGGILVFSGSLYALALTGKTWLGAITPLGGICFLSGWISLAVGVKR